MEHTYTKKVMFFIWNSNLTAPIFYLATVARLGIRGKILRFECM